MRLDGKVAIVTGGTRGLGWSITRAYLREGATVISAARRGPDDGLAAEDPGVGKLEFASVDVDDPDSVAHLVNDTVHRHGRIDVMVANAGINRDGLVESLPVDDWNAVLSTNISGAFHCIRAVVAPMRAAGGGRIITVSSSLAGRVAVGAAAYSASKAAVEALTRVSAIELGRHGIQVNCLSPGFLDEGMGKELTRNPALWKMYRSRFSLGRPGRADEAAAAAVFLACDESSYVNGHVLEVNGGLLWA